MSVGVRDLSRLSTPCYRLRIVLYRPILSSLGPNLGPPMEMPHWVRELRRRWLSGQTAELDDLLACLDEDVSLLREAIQSDESECRDRHCS